VQFNCLDHPALTAVARYGLPIDACGALRPALVHDATFQDFRLACLTDRLSGLAAAAIRAGDVEVPTTGGDQIIEDWHTALKASVILEAFLTRVAQRFEDLDLRWAVTKGAAVAHLDFNDPAMRCFGDVDVVVHPADWARCVQAFAGEVRNRQATRRFTHDFGKGETITIDDMELDLHRRFAVGRYGVRSAMAECFDELDTLTLAGHSLPALSPPSRLLHACFHAVLGGNRGLRSFRDVAQIALTHEAALDQAWDTAARWDVQAVIATALVDAWRLLHLAEDHPVVTRARQMPISRGDRRALRVFANDRRFRSQALTAWPALPWFDRPRFLFSAAAMFREVR
jgi:hypothetical protein